MTFITEIIDIGNFVDADRPIFAGRFNTDQRHFLDYHRQEIFLKSAL